MTFRSATLYDTPKVGGDTLAYCTRCKMELAHIIVAMVGTTPARVICKTCRGEHNYKRQTGFVAQRAKRAPVEKKQTLRVADLWEKKMSEHYADEVLPYATSSEFKMGNVINHPQFGLGIVEEVKRHGKIVVLFRLGEKILVHGMNTGS